MSISQLLHTMCVDLSDADLNAIRKARGFSAKETASRTSFASFFVTSIGLETAMQGLSPEEAIALRLLHETGEVDITFFERIYGTDDPHGTYTQRYKSTFDNVKKNLVRRGLVVMAEVKTRNDSVQLERWRFGLPSEFLPYLPALPTIHSDQDGQANNHTIRKKLLQLIGGGPAFPNDSLSINIQHGSIYLDKAPFTLAAFALWQLKAWASCLRIVKSNSDASLLPTEAALKLLSRQAWITPQALEPALKI
jgi:hypothetical protein